MEAAPGDGDARALAALVTASAALVVAVVGPLVNALLARRDRTRARVERARDVQIALAAEIRAYVAALERFDYDDYGAWMAARMREAEAEGVRFVPFVPRESNATVFRALLPDIQLLPEAAVDSVVIYYQQVEAVAVLADDMRAPDYAALPADRRADVYASYLALKKEALRMGRAALDDLGASLGAPSRGLSSRASARSGR